VTRPSFTLTATSLGGGEVLAGDLGRGSDIAIPHHRHRDLAVLAMALPIAALLLLVLAGSAAASSPHTHPNPPLLGYRGLRRRRDGGVGDPAERSTARPCHHPRPEPD